MAICTDGLADFEKPMMDSKVNFQIIQNETPGIVFDVVEK